VPDEAITPRIDAPGEQDTSREQKRPTLRLALAMRGGVSLAVWMGGAVAELDVLRRATSTREGALASTVSLPSAPSSNRDAEAKRLREDLREDRREIYRDLLDLADVDHVEIDVLAGASAGGLNAVLYGTALANGKRIDDMRVLWEGLAELRSLVRQTAKRWGHLVPSPLRGDEYFYLALRDRLTRLAAAAPPHDKPVPDDPDEPKPAARYLTVALSATMLPKIDQHGVRERRERGADSGRASFGFELRPTSEPRSILSDLPTGDPLDPEWRNFLVDRLALAGRSTASFPGAFEPARVYADQGHQGVIYRHQRRRRLPWPWRRTVVVEDPMSRYRRRPLMQMPDMVDVFSATRPTTPEPADEPFGVVDGGVLDNIAVGRALTAIAHTAAEVHTKRWLIYLDPDPAKAPVPRFGSLRPPAFTVPRLILSLAGMRAASRTVRDDLEGLQQHNERAQARRAATEAFSRQLMDRVRSATEPFDSTDPQRVELLRNLGRRLAQPDGGEPMRTYARLRAAADLPRITRLLVRPQLTISGQIVRTKGFDPWYEASTGEVMLKLRDPVRDWYADSIEEVKLHLDLTAVIETADFLIAWTRVLELWHYRSNFTRVDHDWELAAGDRKRVKRVLYRVLFIATALRDLADQEMLDKSGAPRNDPKSAIADRVRTALQRVHTRQNSYIISSRLDEFFNLNRDERNRRTPIDSDATFYDAAAAYLAGEPTDPDRDLPMSQRKRAVQQSANLYLWMRLTELFDQVCRHSTALPARHGERPGDDELDRPWRDSPFHLLTLYPELVRHDPAAADPARPALARLGPIFAGAGGLPDSTQMVAFDTFTADQFSPLYRHMPGLRNAVMADWARSMLQGRMLDVHRPWLDSRTKLAGNQLANFAGFLDRRWRNNDWMWGRADSAANTVSLLIEQVDHRHVTTGTPATRPTVIEAANRLATRVWPQEPTPQAWSEAKLKQLGEAITETLQTSVVRELLHTAFGDDEPGRWRSSTPRMREFIDLAKLTTGQETPAVLAPHQRSGLIMHGGLLLFRAMLPSRRGPRTSLIRVAAQVVRPLYVLALLLAMPARAGLLLGLVLTGAAVSGAGGHGHSAVRAGVLGAITLTGCFLLILRAVATHRRLGEATKAVKSSEEDLDHREIPPTSTAVLTARDDAVKLAWQAVDIIARVRWWRMAVASIATLVALVLTVAVWRWWSRVTPWLQDGNGASFGALVVAELGAFVVIWRASDGLLRARTGTRRPTQPWFVWTLAAGAVAAAVAAGHVDDLMTRIHLRAGTDSILDAGASSAIGVGAVLLCAMVLVSTFDWMHLGWLIPAWAAALLVYSGLLVGLDGVGQPNTVFGDVLIAALAYGLSFTYVITVFCASRYPRRQSQFPEPVYDASGRLRARRWRLWRSPRAHPEPAYEAARP
jgi:patatin-related protein